MSTPPGSPNAADFTAQQHTQNLGACVAALESARQLHVAVASGNPDLARVVNVSMFALVWNADLSVLLYELRSGSHLFGVAAGWQQRLTARLLAVTLFEAVDDFIELLGHDLRRSAVQVGAHSAVQEVTRLHQVVRQFRDTEGPQLKRVRETILAHRDHDASAQVTEITSLDIGALYQAGRRFLEWASALHSVTTDIVNQYNALAPATP